jgi:hypothetical protein
VDGDVEWPVRKSKAIGLGEGIFGDKNFESGLFLLFRAQDGFLPITEY